MQALLTSTVPSPLHGCWDPFGFDAQKCAAYVGSGEGACLLVVKSRNKVQGMLRRTSRRGSSTTRTSSCHRFISVALSKVYRRVSK